MQAIKEIYQVYRAEQPAIVHHVALKAILLGTIAARLARLPVIINAFTGLGLLFLGQTTKVRLLRPC